MSRVSSRAASPRSRRTPRKRVGRGGHATPVRLQQITAELDHIQKEVYALRVQVAAFQPRTSASEPKRPSKTKAPTKLEAFLRTRKIKPAHVSRLSGYSRQHLLRIRKGRMNATARCIAAVTAAVRQLTGEEVRANDLFELDPA